MPNDKWIHFPKNPYGGQVFYYPATKEIQTYNYLKQEEEQENA